MRRKLKDVGKVRLIMNLSIHLACFIALFTRCFYFYFVENLIVSFAIGRIKSKGTDLDVGFFV